MEGDETADMLVQEVFSREIRDRRALARYAGLTGAPDESGQTRRERGLAKAGNARVRRGMTCSRRPEAAATRRWTMAFAPRFRMGPPLGASPPMRMTASWCDLRGRPNTSS